VSRLASVDRRRKQVRITPRGVEALALSAMIFDDIRSRWASSPTSPAVSATRTVNTRIAPAGTFRLDVPGWFGA